MAELRDALGAAGFDAVRTYIQSGNVILDSGAGADEVSETIETVIEARFGFRPAVAVRTRDQVASALDRHPYLGRTDDHTKLHVLFCKTTPDPAGVAEIDHDRFTPDELSADGPELFAYYPNGAGRSKLTLDEDALGTAVTARNLKTVAKLLELTV